MRVIVTRPASQAADWVIDLRARGLDAVALPLIGIEAVADAHELIEAWHALAQQRLVTFVSPNAAHHFFAQRPADATWPTGVLAGSPGPGTTRALLGLGVPASLIVEPAADAAQFDSESLWAQLQQHAWRDAGVLVVRGDGGRDWLAERLRQAGAQVAHLAAYRRTTPRFSDAERALLTFAIAAPPSHLWLLSSSEAIDNLALIAPAGSEWGQARAIATHPRIAVRARQLGFASVTEARPSFDAVVACIQSIRP
ncbi:MAG: uroporphyrinogen-III synthase [Burkholderiales bacterium]